MANDILNTSNGTSGNQNQGDIIVKTSGKGTNGRQIYSGHRQTSTVLSIASKYDTRLDDVAYYGAPTSGY